MPPLFAAAGWIIFTLKRWQAGDIIFVLVVIVGYFKRVKQNCLPQQPGRDGRADGATPIGHTSYSKAPSPVSEHHLHETWSATMEVTMRSFHASSSENNITGSIGGIIWLIFHHGKRRFRFLLFGAENKPAPTRALFPLVFSKSFFCWRLRG